MSRLRKVLAEDGFLSQEEIDALLRGDSIDDKAAPHVNDYKNAIRAMRLAVMNITGYGNAANWQKDMQAYVKARDTFLKQSDIINNAEIAPEQYVAILKTYDNFVTLMKRTGHEDAFNESQDVQYANEQNEWIAKKIKAAEGEEETVQDPIKVIESNPDNGQVIWSSLNKQGQGVFVSYNQDVKQFFCFQNFDAEGLKNPDETVRLNKKSLKDQFEAAKRKACKMTSLNISPTHGFQEKEIVSLDKFVTKKQKRQDEQELTAPGAYTPSIEQMITRYVPEQREDGEAAGHIYGVYYDKKMNMLMAMNIDSNGNIVAQEQVDPEKQQDAFNKAEEAIIKAMDDDAQWYRRDAENSPQELGLMIDINQGPWQQFNEKQVKEQEKVEEEKQKQEEEDAKEDEQEEQTQEEQQPEPEKTPEPEKQPENTPAKDTKQKDDKEKKNKDEEHLYSTNTRTISILFEGKDSAIINEFASGLNNDKLVIGYEILPGYTYKQSSYSLSRILTALSLFKHLVNQGPMSKTAGLRKTACFIRRTRLRKFAYNYVNILKELATDLVTDTQGMDVASIYFTKDTDNATDNSACGFIVIYNGKYIAFGPGASDDIVTIDTACIQEMRDQDPAADVNSPKIDMNNFVARAESMGLPSLQVFGSSAEAEQWINQVNNNNVKGRVVLNHEQEFEDTDDMWDNIDELGENPDLKPEDIQRDKPKDNDKPADDKKEDEKKEEKPKSEQQKWNELPDDEKTWQLRITYKNWPAIVVKLRDFLDSNPDVVKNRSKITI